MDDDDAFTGKWLPFLEQTKTAATLLKRMCSGTELDLSKNVQKMLLLMERWWEKTDKSNFTFLCHPSEQRLIRLGFLCQATAIYKNQSKQSVVSIQIERLRCGGNVVCNAGRIIKRRASVPTFRIWMHRLRVEEEKGPQRQWLNWEHRCALCEAVRAHSEKNNKCAGGKREEGWGWLAGKWQVKG